MIPDDFLNKYQKHKADAPVLVDLFKITKKCNACHTPCMAGEFICPNCEAYKFDELQKSDEKS